MAAANFRDLIVWQTYELSVKTYAITKNSPKSEMFGLISQMTRAAVSVCSNIAEGFGGFGVKEKDKFYVISTGSLTELECQYLLARGIGYITEPINLKIMTLIDETQRLLSGLQKPISQRETEARFFNLQSIFYNLSYGTRIA